MSDHLGVRVSDLAKSREFYRQALASLGYGALREFPGAFVLDPDANNVEAVCHRPE